MSSPPSRGMGSCCIAASLHDQGPMPPIYNCLSIQSEAPHRSLRERSCKILSLSPGIPTRCDGNPRFLDSQEDRAVFEGLDAFSLHQEGSLDTQLVEKQCSSE